MPRLYYRYGAMGSYKTATALMCRFNYVQKGANVLVWKPQVDLKQEEKKLVSKTGLTAPCKTFTKDENLLSLFEKENEKQKVDVIVLDEVQFCTKKQINQLREIAEMASVFCFGLKTNFKGELFEGTKRLLEVADSIHEIQSVCDCGKKAIMNGRFVGNFMEVDGEEIELGEEKYKGLCWTCFKREQDKAKVHNKIAKYVKLFSNRKSAGKWSTDTALDNVVLQPNYVIYDKDVQEFISDFKDFRITSPDVMMIFDGKADTLRKISVRGKSFDFCMTLITDVLKFEKTMPGLLKSLIEDGTIAKWLKQIQKILSQHKSEFVNK